MSGLLVFETCGAVILGLLVLLLLMFCVVVVVVVGVVFAVVVVVVLAAVVLAAVVCKTCSCGEVLRAYPGLWGYPKYKPRRMRVAYLK